MHPIRRPPSRPPPTPLPPAAAPAAAGVGRTRVVSFWASDPSYARHSLRFYLSGVTASAAVVGIFSHLRTTWALYLGLGASKRLHAALLRRVLHAPVSFFDTTPVGRTIQRFSKDTDQVEC